MTNPLTMCDGSVCLIMYLLLGKMVTGSDEILPSSTCAKLGQVKHLFAQGCQSHTALTICHKFHVNKLHKLNASVSIIMAKLENVHIFQELETFFYDTGGFYSLICCEVFWTSHCGEILNFTDISEEVIASLHCYS